MSIQNKVFSDEKLSGIAYWHDATAYVFIPTTSLNSGAAALTAIAAIGNISKWKEATLYVDSSAANVRAATTGLTITMQCRPSSAVAWQTFRAESGCDESGLTILKIIGSGNQNTSGMTHFGDIRVNIANISDSGSATVQAWLFGRSPQ